MDSDLLDFGNVEIEQSSKFGEKFKLKKDETARIGIIYPKEGKGALKSKKSLWFADSDGNKFNIDVSCIPDDLKSKFKLDEAKQKIGCLVVRYKVDKAGKLISPLEFDILEWIFSTKKYNELLQINNEYPLSTVDLSVKCVDEKFQDYTLVPTKGSAYLAANIQNAVLEKAMPMYKSLDRSLGHTYDKEELNAMLGLKCVPSGIINEPSTMEDILKNI